MIITCHVVEWKEVGCNGHVMDIQLAVTFITCTLHMFIFITDFFTLHEQSTTCKSLHAIAIACNGHVMYEMQ